MNFADRGGQPGQWLVVSEAELVFAELSERPRRLTWLLVQVALKATSVLPTDLVRRGWLKGKPAKIRRCARNCG